jgi:bifunctional UDP-N-acetylglucosamine pyrophosphorylase/glucosamine-1-phosphate N-acetyltransferase
VKKTSVAVVILAAGKGTRMKSDLPKVLFRVAGRPMVHHVLRAALNLRPARVVVVVGHGAAEVRASISGAFTGADAKCIRFALQREQKGTGHALRAALPALGGFKGTVIVLSGDVPLIGSDTLDMLVDAHRRSGNSATLLSFRPADPTGYGRILRDPRGLFVDIVEEKDADFEHKTIAEVNAGLYAFDSVPMTAALRKLKSENAQKEFYLTDLPRLMRSENRSVGAVRVLDPEVVAGVNTLGELAAAGAVMQRRVLELLMASGVEIVDPTTTFIAPDARIGAGSRIEPFTVIGPGVRLGTNCVIGPFTHLRQDAVLGDGVSLGNFVELKNTRLGDGCKVRHLTYLGDADVGRNALVGAGTITCNYDGKRKNPTTIGEGAFLGSGTLLVAPVTVGPRAVTGAGTVVLSGHDVAEGTTVVGVPARVVSGRDVPRRKASGKKLAARKRGASTGTGGK